MAHHIKHYLLNYPEFVGQTSANLTNINMIIGGGGVVKPDYFRNGFDLINNNDHNNIHNHLTADGAQQIYYQLKHHLTILSPLAFIISDEAENEAALNQATAIDPPDIRLVFFCSSKILSLQTYWTKGSYTFVIAGMNINLNEMDGNDFSWKLESNQILAAQEMLKDVPEKLNNFN
ncbi:unnamed protein product [Adineta steineri]|uniref:Uncharacterized protein n=1 Tax=Adineta steineri TaxID=433720 RepID=A0A814X6Q7_9BILA|nr:unnamed protein product [Adineta steineri]